MRAAADTAHPAAPWSRSVRAERGARAPELKSRVAQVGGGRRKGSAGRRVVSWEPRPELARAEGHPGQSRTQALPEAGTWRTATSPTLGIWESGSLMASRLYVFRLFSKLLEEKDGAGPKVRMWMEQYGLIWGEGAQEDACAGRRWPAGASFVSGLSGTAASGVPSDWNGCPLRG